MDPLRALADIVVGWHAAGQLQGWLRLLFGITFSFAVTFNTVCGGALATGGDVSVSVGMGMVSGAAMAAVAFFRANKKLTEGVVVALPQKTVEDQITPDGRGPMVSLPPEKK